MLLNPHFLFIIGCELNNFRNNSVIKCTDVIYWFIITFWNIFFISTIIFASRSNSNLNYGCINVEPFIYSFFVNKLTMEIKHYPLKSFMKLDIKRTNHHLSFNKHRKTNLVKQLNQKRKTRYLQCNRLIRPSISYRWCIHVYKSNICVLTKHVELRCK